MKKFLMALCLVPAFAWSQQLGVKVDADGDQDTTIRVEKGRKADQKFEVTDGSDEVLGDTAPLLQDARKNWKKACAEWKTEIKDLNKENLISVNCGAMACSTEAMESSCKSHGKYKARVQIK